jgi:hypothetical protein
VLRLLKGERNCPHDNYHGRIRRELIDKGTQINVQLSWTNQEAIDKGYTDKCPVIMDKSGGN